jgi:hypothetical protein
MVLEAQQLEAFQGSSGHGKGGAALLVAYGAVAATSAVVSGSIVVAGNVVYWYEKQGHCAKQ